MQHSLVKDIFAGVIGVSAVAGLGAISVIELMAGKPFSEPGSLTAIAVAAVAYFYTARAQDTASNTQAQTVQAVRTAINGTGSVPGAPGGTPEPQPAVQEAK